MRRRVFVIVLCLFCGLLPGLRAGAQQYEIEQLLLNFEKLTQLKQILSDMKGGYEIIVQGYRAIKNIAEGNFSLHKLFLDKMLEVSPVVRNYHKVSEIVQCQVFIAREYKNGLRLFRGSSLLNAGEIEYLSHFYNNLFKESLKSLDDLTMTVTAGRLRMSDDERLMRIDMVHVDMQSHLMALRSFNGHISDVILERERLNAQLDAVKAAHGIDK